MVKILDVLTGYQNQPYDNPKTYLDDLEHRIRSRLDGPHDEQANGLLAELAELRKIKDPAITAVLGVRLGEGYQFLCGRELEAERYSLWQYRNAWYPFPKLQVKILNYFWVLARSHPPSGSF